MIRSLRTGITGLRSNQLRLDVIGNNISGVNTVGFKRSRVLFQDALTQRIATGGQLHGPNATNPSYVGHGVAVGAGAKVLGPITIGAGSVIGANAVVTRDAPEDSVLTGIPAKARARRSGETTRSILSAPEYQI